jgi:hypothetical protein
MPGVANRQSAANTGILGQARDKEAARTAGNRSGKPDRMDLVWIGFMGLLFLWGVIQLDWSECE